MCDMFGFHLPTRVEVGNGLRRATGRLAREVAGGDRVLLVTDPGVRATGLADEVWSSLREAGYDGDWFDLVAPNPRDHDCEAGGERARRLGADVIVAVGGGSVLDTAKAIGLLRTYGGRIRDYEGRGRVPGEVAPVVAVPTTAGTGSEVTRSAVITDTARHIKMTVKDIALAPKLAVVDPECTYALPAGVTAATGMDALVHAIEAYTCRLANPLSDLLALGAVRLIFPALSLAVGDGSDRGARYDMMVGSLMAGIAFSHADVGAVHCMAEALSGMYDTPHGVANSLFLPVVTAFNAPADPDRHAALAAACGLPVTGLPAVEAASLLVTELVRLAGAIGIPALAEVPGVNPRDFEHLAESAWQNGSTPSNCRRVGKEDYLRLFENSYGGA